MRAGREFFQFPLETIIEHCFYFTALTIRSAYSFFELHKANEENKLFDHLL